MLIKFRYNNERLGVKVEYIEDINIYGIIGCCLVNSELKEGEQIRGPLCLVLDVMHFCIMLLYMIIETTIALLSYTSLAILLNRLNIVLRR